MARGRGVEGRGRERARGEGRRGERVLKVGPVRRHGDPRRASRAHRRRVGRGGRGRRRRGDDVDVHLRLGRLRRRARHRVLVQILRERGRRGPVRRGLAGAVVVRLAVAVAAAAFHDVLERAQEAPAEAQARLVRAHVVALPHLDERLRGRLARERVAALDLELERRAVDGRVDAADAFYVLLRASEAEAAEEYLRRAHKLVEDTIRMCMPPSPIRSSDGTVEFGSVVGRLSS